MAKLDVPLFIVTQYTNAVKKAIVEIYKLYMERQVTNILNMRNGLKIDAVHDLPLNSPVLVWREGGVGRLGH
jgi:hypothetical protein